MTKVMLWVTGFALLFCAMRIIGDLPEMSVYRAPLLVAGIVTLWAYIIAGAVAFIDSED